MPTLRHIPVPFHGPLELVLGLALLAVPFLAGFSPAGTAVSLLLGVCAVGLALGATPTERGTAALPLSAMRSFTQALGLGSLAAGAVLGLGGDLPALFALVALGIGHLLLDATVHWTQRA